MDRIEWERDINLLWYGKLELPEPEDNGLSQFSAAWLPDLRRYITALEHGYREQAKMLRLYRAQTSRGASLGKLMENQWSNDAALGYAAMGMQIAAIRPDQGVLALDAMMEAMERYSLDEAREVERGLREGDGSDGGTGDPSSAGAGDPSYAGAGDPSSGPCWATFPPGGRIWTEDGGRPVTAHTETRDGEMPRVIGPSAEFVPEG